MLLALRRLSREVGGVLAISFVLWSCERAPTALQQPSTPLFDDYGYGACPTCRSPSAKELQQIQAALIYLEDRCPTLADAAYEIWNTHRVMVYTLDDTTWGHTWFADDPANSPGADTIAIWVGTFSATGADDNPHTYSTLAHETAHVKWGPQYGESYALMSEYGCPGGTP